MWINSNYSYSKLPSNLTWSLLERVLLRVSLANMTKNWVVSFAPTVLHGYHYKKWTGKKSENENMMNSLNKRKKIQDGIQAPTYAAEVLEPFSYLYNDSMENQHYQQALAKKAWRKINTSTLSTTAIAENFSYFSGQNAQSNFLQWRAPLESSISVSNSSGSVRFLVHKYVNRRVRGCQSKYISEKKVQVVVMELETSPMW